LRRVNRRDVAQDLSQEVYLRMLRAPEESAIQNPQAYLFTVAKNLLREYRLKEHRASQTLDVDDPVVHEDLAVMPGFGAEIDLEQRKRRLHRALRELPAKCQAAIVMQNWYGMTYEEIAEKLGVTPHAVKKYVGRALAHCRTRMVRLG